MTTTTEPTILTAVTKLACILDLLRSLPEGLPEPRVSTNGGNEIRWQSVNEPTARRIVTFFGRNDWNVSTYYAEPCTIATRYLDATYDATYIHERRRHRHRGRRRSHGDPRHPTHPQGVVMAHTPRNINVKLTLDTTQFEAAMSRANDVLADLQRGVALAGRTFWRSRLTPGEQHIDRICREVAGKPDAALRLFVAAGCVAPALDGEAS